MRQLLPEVPEPVDETGAIDGLYVELSLPEPGDELPFTYLGMVTSIDGAATIEGTSGGLGGTADRRAFRALRETCDAILVGAGTARDEGYRPPRTSDETVAARRRRGLEDVPTIVLVTRRVDLDPRLPLFVDNPVRPIVLTSVPAEVPAGLDAVADVVRAGGSDVDLTAGLGVLRARGLRYLLCEGGPSLNRALLAAGLVDELFVTVAPKLVAGGGPRIVHGAAFDAPVGLELRSAFEHDSELVLRYRVRRGT